MKFGKKKEESKASPCASCDVPQRPQINPAEAMKQLQEMEKQKVKSMPCPFLNDCDFKMIPEIGKLLCMDYEDGTRQDQAYMVHMSKHHMWEQCRKYNDRMREEKGVLPRDLPALLKLKKEK